MDYEMIILKIKKEIEQFTSSNSSHDYFHLIRVYNNALRITSQLGVIGENRFVVLASALLHDIGRDNNNYLAKIDEHEKVSSMLAADLLVKYRVPDHLIEQIKLCILGHRASKNQKVDDICTQILCDSDRLDSLGAIAIARTFSYDSTRPLYLPDDVPKEVYDGISNSSINHIIEKVLNFTPDVFYTVVARQIAGDRLQYAKDYVKEFLDEWNGYK